MSTERRKRKWDVPAEPGTPEAAAATLGIMPSIGTSIDPSIPSERAQAAVAIAAAAADRINAMLRDKGLGYRGPQLPDGFSRDVPVNDCKPEVRYVLTKGGTHDTIFRETGATVTTRGIYRPPGSPAGDELPLYLHVTADDMATVDKGVIRIENMIRQLSSSCIVAKVHVNMENVFPEFQLCGRIVGPKGSFVKHITNETGARVSLRGLGSGFLEAGQVSPEPLHFYIQAASQASADSARALAENLMAHVRAEYKTFLEQRNQPPPPLPGPLQTAPMSMPVGQQWAYGAPPVMAPMAVASGYPSVAGYSGVPAYSQPLGQEPYFSYQSQPSLGVSYGGMCSAAPQPHVPSAMPVASPIYPQPQPETDKGLLSHPRPLSSEPERDSKRRFREFKETPVPDTKSNESVSYERPSLGPQLPDHPGTAIPYMYPAAPPEEEDRVLMPPPPQPSSVRSKESKSSMPPPPQREATSSKVQTSKESQGLIISDKQNSLSRSQPKSLSLVDYPTDQDSEPVPEPKASQSHSPSSTIRPSNRPFWAADPPVTAPPLGRGSISSDSNVKFLT